VTLDDVLASDRRLVILRSLADQNFELNDSVLQVVLDEFGHNVSRDVVRTELSWLAEQGLVTLEDVGKGRVIVATLTERGGDVAAGRAKVPGVRRPSAGRPSPHA
jgi:DNA-binding transcriptional ArsR family regulator